MSGRGRGMKVHTRRKAEKARWRLARWRLIARIERNLERIEPFESWAKKVSPTPEMKRLYWSVVRDFRMILLMIETQEWTRH